MSFFAAGQPEDLPFLSQASTITAFSELDSEDGFLDLTAVPDLATTILALLSELKHEQEPVLRAPVAHYHEENALPAQLDIDRILGVNNSTPHFRAVSPTQYQFSIFDNSPPPSPALDTPASPPHYHGVPFNDFRLHPTSPPPPPSPTPAAVTPPVTGRYRSGKPRNAWDEHEMERAIHHFLAAHDEGVRFEARFGVASERLRMEGIHRSPAAVKNFWVREGRERCGFDERRKKNWRDEEGKLVLKPLSGSKQARKGERREKKVVNRRERVRADAEGDDEHDDEDEAQRAEEAIREGLWPMMEGMW